MVIGAFLTAPATLMMTAGACAMCTASVGARPVSPSIVCIERGIELSRLAKGYNGAYDGVARLQAVRLVDGEGRQPP